jgi:hypothetical protein
MIKLVAATTPILLAATIAASPAAQGQTPAAVNSPTADARQVTVVGCVARNGDVDIDKGTRTLNIAQGALALTSARVLSGSATGGVPGTPPQDHDSGTIPQRTIVGGQSAPLETTSFALTGGRTGDLGKLVGQRVEIVGRLSEGATAASAPQPRGTTGAVQPQSAGNRTGTREERSGESSAHPSAELRNLEVVSFKGVTGGCE